MNESEEDQNDAEMAAEPVLSTMKGRLFPDGRLALTELLSRGSIYSASKPDLYSTIIAQREIIEGIMSDMELDLLVDSRIGLASISARGEIGDENEDEDSSRLLRRRRLSLYDTFVALLLRKHYRDREQAGDKKIIIELDDLQASLMPFLPLTNSESRDKRALNSTVKRFKDMNLLATVRGSEDKFELTPVIRLVVDLNWLESLLEQYKTLAASKAEQPDE